MLCYLHQGGTLFFSRLVGGLLAIIYDLVDCFMCWIFYGFMLNFSISANRICSSLVTLRDLFKFGYAKGFCFHDL